MNEPTPEVSRPTAPAGWHEARATIGASPRFGRFAVQRFHAKGGSAAAAPNDAQLADQYGGRAIDLLRQAIAKGYKDVEHLKTDDDLQALREREDYKKLLKELQRKN